MLLSKKCHRGGVDEYFIGESSRHLIIICPCIIRPFLSLIIILYETMSGAFTISKLLEGFHQMQLIGGAVKRIINFDLKRDTVFAVHSFYE